jgi:hypothetical protein
MMQKRKRKTKHIKLLAVGGNATLQIGTKTITVKVTIPRNHLNNRLK